MMMEAAVMMLISTQSATWPRRASALLPLQTRVHLVLLLRLYLQWLPPRLLRLLRLQPVQLLRRASERLPLHLHMQAAKRALSSRLLLQALKHQPEQHMRCWQCQAQLQTWTQTSERLMQLPQDHRLHPLSVDQGLLRQRLRQLQLPRLPPSQAHRAHRSRVRSVDMLSSLGHKQLLKLQLAQATLARSPQHWRQRACTGVCKRQHSQAALRS